MYARNVEIKVGLVLLAAGLALLGLLYFATGGGILKPRRHVHMRIAPGPLAPKEGDRITMRGIEVGSADSVGLWTEITQSEPGPGESPGAARATRTVYVHVIAKLDDDLRIPDGTRGRISDTITGTRVLELIPGALPGDLSDADTVARPIVVEQVADLARIAERIDEVAADARGLLGAATTTFEHATATVDEAKAALAGLRARVEGGDLDRALENVAAASGSLKNAAAAVEQRIGPITDDLAQAASDFGRLAASGARLAQRLEEDVATVMADVRSVLTKVDTIVADAAPRVDRLLASVEGVGTNVLALAEDLRRQGPRVERILKGVDRDLTGVLELLQDAGQNLVDATETIRASPWLLLSEPSADVVAQADLRSAMQNYVRAMTRLDRSARTVKDLLTTDVADAETEALLRRALAMFESSLDRYRLFESQLMDLLGAPPSTAPAVPAAGRAAPPPPPPSGAPRDR